MRKTLRAVPTLLRVGFAGAVAYRSEFLVWVLATTMPLVMLALFWAVAEEAPVGRFGQREFAAYYLATWIVRQLTGSWVVWDMNMEIRQGTLGMRLLRPIHPFLSYGAENVAAIPFRFLVSLPMALLALAWVGPGAFSGDPLLWALAALSTAGAWLMNFCAMAMIGTLGLYWERSIALFDLWLGLFFIFAGYLIPLALFPAWLAPVVRWLPFRFIQSLPVELALGLVDRREALAAVLVQWAYAAALLAGSLALWRRGVARFQAYGG